eukprot:6010040-Pyramimonas_sp.AAC.1
MGIHETLVNVSKECARRCGESHILNKNHPESVKRLQIVKTNLRGAAARATCGKQPALNP